MARILSRFDVWTDEAQALYKSSIVRMLEGARRECLKVGISPSWLAAIDRQIADATEGPAGWRFASFEIAGSFQGTHFHFNIRGRVQLVEKWSDDGETFEGFEVEAEVIHGSGGVTFEETRRSAQLIVDVWDITNAMRSELDLLGLKLCRMHSGDDAVIDPQKEVAKKAREELAIAHYGHGRAARELWEAWRHKLAIERLNGLSFQTHWDHKPADMAERKAWRKLHEAALVTVTEKRGQAWSFALTELSIAHLTQWAASKSEG